MADELIDVLNSNGSFTGAVELKSKAHNCGLWHASAHVWIFTPKGEILIQKRAADKDTFPDLWDISVAGHLSSGDTPIEAAIRETNEEIGLHILNSDLIYLKTITNCKRPTPIIYDNEFNHIFICKASFKISQLRLQTEEVAAIKLLDLNTFELELYENYNAFVPHGLAYYQYIIENIKTAID